MARTSPTLALLLAAGCTDLVGRTPARDGGAEVADADVPADVDVAPTDAPALPQDVAPPPGCALAPAARAGSEVAARGAALMSALTAGFHVKSAVLDARGGVVVFGGSSMCGRPGNFDAAAIRFGADGAFDAGFGAGGRLCLNTAVDGEDQNDLFLAAAVDDAGRLVFVGSSESARTLAQRGLIARTTADGALDLGFAAQGWRHVYEAPSLTQSADTVFWGVLVDGPRVVAVGSDASPFRLPSRGVVAAFDDAGELDRAFAGRGLLFDFVRYFHSVARRSDGYILSGTERSAARVSLRALAPDGAPLRSFGDGGVAVHALPQDAYAGSLLVDDEGGVLVVRGVPGAGNPLLNATADVIRFLPDGRSDTDFGAGGAYATGDGWTYAYSHGHHLARHCNGRVVFAGQSAGASLRVHRIDARGRPDPSFGNIGVATLRGAGRPGIIVGAANVAVDPATADVVVASGTNANDAIYVRAASP